MDKMVVPVLPLSKVGFVVLSLGCTNIAGWLKNLPIFNRIHTLVSSFPGAEKIGSRNPGNPSYPPPKLPPQ